jgi:hypothetical protein
MVYLVACGVKEEGRSCYPLLRKNPDVQLRLFVPIETFVRARHSIEVAFFLECHVGGGILREAGPVRTSLPFRRRFSPVTGPLEL